MQIKQAVKNLHNKSLLLNNRNYCCYDIATWNLERVWGPIEILNFDSKPRCQYRVGNTGQKRDLAKPAVTITIRLRIDSTGRLWEFENIYSESDIVWKTGTSPEVGKMWLLFLGPWDLRMDNIYITWRATRSRRRLDIWYGAQVWNLNPLTTSDVGHFWRLSILLRQWRHSWVALWVIWWYYYCVESYISQRVRVWQANGSGWILGSCVILRKEDSARIWVFVSWVQSVAGHAQHFTTFVWTDWNTHMI